MMESYSHDQVVAKLKEAGYWSSFWPKTTDVILDTSFRLPTDEQVMEIVRADQTNLREYRPNDYDCDNFAFDLRYAFGGLGWCLGVIVVKRKTPPNHGLFFWINDQHQVKILEPQTDDVLNEKGKFIAVIMY